MPKEAKTFNSADASWKRLMKSIKDSSGAKKLADDFKQRTHYNTLKNNNATFEIIQKALDELLERKREVF